MTRYWRRMRAIELALWLATVALAVVQAVLVGAVRVVELLAPFAWRLAERVVDLVVQVDQGSDPASPAGQDTSSRDDPARSEKSAGVVVVEGEVVSVREEKVA